MKKYNKFLLLLIFCLSISTSKTFAAQTPVTKLSATNGEIKSITTNGGQLSANIDTQDGKLSNALTPGFLITTNSNTQKSLQLTATCNTQEGAVNAFFFPLFSLDYHYIALTNSNVLPQSHCVDCVKKFNGALTCDNNPNVIAYRMINLKNIPNVMDVYYDNNYNRWDITLLKRGVIPLNLEIPAGEVPLTNTYSTCDEAGSYQATITLSFI